MKMFLVEFPFLETKTDESGFTFRSVMKTIMTVGKFLGQNPASDGLYFFSTRFPFICIRIWYSISVTLLLGVATCLCMHRVYTQEKNYNTIGYVFFFSSVFANSIFFWRISLKWAKLVEAVEATEAADPMRDPSVTSRCNRTVALIATLALTEHALVLISKFARLSDCYPEEERTFKTFIEFSFPFVFELKCPFSLPLAFVLQYMNFITTMNWNYSDVFIICISYYLRARFEQLNNQINAAKGKYVDACFWRRARAHYTRLVELVRHVDDVISPVVFVSFASNLFFICFQLYYCIASGLNDIIVELRCPYYPSGIFNGHEREIYLVFSVSLLLLRSIAVTFIAAGVHSATLEPAAALYSVPSPVFCIEVQRFIDQVQGSVVALTGLRLFNVTRGIFLSVAGTAVTYELVLFQFSSADRHRHIESDVNYTSVEPLH